MGKKWYSYFVVTEERGDTAEASTATASLPARPQPRVSDIVPAIENETTFAKPVAGPIDLRAVYDAAKIVPPAHGYTVLKVAEMLRSEHIRALPNEVKHKSVMVALDAAGVTVQKALEELRAQTTAENQRIEEEIARRASELRARIDANNKKAKSEQDDFLAWQRRKRQEEATIAEGVSHFVTENPITTTPVAKREGGTDVR